MNNSKNPKHDYAKNKKILNFLKYKIFTASENYSAKIVRETLQLQQQLSKQQNAKLNRRGVLNLKEKLRWQLSLMQKFINNNNKKKMFFLQNDHINKYYQLTARHCTICL